MKMKQCFVVGLLILIGNIAWGQIPQDNYHYFSLSELDEVPADSVYALDLTKNKLTELPESLAKYKHLKGLRLSKNKLTRLPDFFMNFSELEFLYLDKNQLTRFPFQIFHLKSLVYLDVSRNRIVNIPTGIKNLTNLLYLDIWDNRIESIDPSFITLQQLREIDFRGTTFSPEFVEQWESSFPETKVHFDPPCTCIK